MQQYKLALDKEFVLDWMENFDITKQASLNSSKLRIVDLYSGCGGMTLGALAATQKNNMNFEIEVAIDFEKEAIEVYKQNFGIYANTIINDDIKTLFDKRRKKSIVDNKSNKIDILMAGPPCQGHSDLNNSTRRNDSRNSLYTYTTKAIKKYKPNLVIIENVSTVIHSTENVVNNTIKFLEKNGYYTKQVKVNFTNLGLPQSRERHILIASYEQNTLDAIKLLDQENEIALYDFISDYERAEDKKQLILKPTNISKENLRRINYLFENEIYDLPNKLRPSCHRDKKHSYNSCYGRLQYDKPSQTITSGFGSMGQGRFVHPTRKRTLLAIEAARIQGFPKSFSFNDGKTLTGLRKMIANAVPPQLTYKITDLYIKTVLQRKKEKRAVTIDMT